MNPVSGPAYTSDHTNGARLPATDLEGTSTFTQMSTSWFGANGANDSVDKGKDMIVEGGGGYIGVCVLVSGPGWHAKLWGGEDWNKGVPTQIPTSYSGQPSPRLRVPGSHYLCPTITKQHANDKRQIIQIQQTTIIIQTSRAPMNEQNGNFNYLACETRDLVLPWQNTLRIDHYLVAW